MTITALYPIFLILLTLAHLLAPQRNGLLAFSQVVAPYLFLPLLLLVPLALRDGAWLAVIAQAVCVALFVWRFTPRLHALTPPRTPGAHVVRLLSWNVLEGGNRAKIRPLLLTRPADIVAMVEADGAWIEGDAELARLYPYRVIRRGEPTTSMVLLSGYPILEQIPAAQLDAEVQPLRLIWARLDLGAGKTLLVVVGHPAPPYIFGGGLPATGYNAKPRDADVLAIRRVVNPLLQAGERVLLVGDCNMTTRDPAYADLGAGMQDAQATVGIGPGVSWRPESLRWQPIAFFRIDYQFASPNITPLSIAVDATPRDSDHSPLLGGYEMR